MTARTAADLWDELVDEAGEELVERAASVSVEQAERELRAAGFDVRAERRRAEGILDALERGAVVEQRKEELLSQARKKALRPERRRSSTVVLFAAAATTAAVGGAAVYAALHRHPEQTPVEPPAPPAPPAPPTSPAPPTVTAPAPTPVETPSRDLVAAADLRRRAHVAFDAGRFTECLSLLDQARAKDPAGDSSQDVSQLRGRAELALEKKK